MLRLSPLAAALLAAPACVIYDTDGPPVARNSAPFFTYADAACGWDDYYRDDVWFFEADVDDYDGPADVVAVYADVYDDYTGEWVDGFELYPEAGITWSSAWVGSSTYLECGYPDYVVDFTAYDTFDMTAVTSVYPGMW
jgi:hypothetical protein